MNEWSKNKGGERRFLFSPLFLLFRPLLLLLFLSSFILLYLHTYSSFFLSLPTFFHSSFLCFLYQKQCKNNDVVFVLLPKSSKWSKRRKRKRERNSEREKARERRKEGRVILLFLSCRWNVSPP